MVNNNRIERNKKEELVREKDKILEKKTKSKMSKKKWKNYMRKRDFEI